MIVSQIDIVISYI